MTQETKSIFGESSNDSPSKALLWHLPPEMIAKILRRCFSSATNEKGRFDALFNGTLLEKDFGYEPATVISHFTSPRETVYRVISFAASYLSGAYNRTKAYEFIDVLGALEDMFPSTLPFKWFIGGQYAAFLNNDVQSYETISIYVILPSIVYQRTRIGSDCIRQELGLLHWLSEDSSEGTFELLAPENMAVQDILDYVNKSGEPARPDAVYLPGDQTMRYRKAGNPFVLELVNGYSFLRDHNHSIQRVTTAADIINHLPVGQRVAYLSDVGRCTIDDEGFLVNAANQRLDKDNNAIEPKAEKKNSIA